MVDRRTLADLVLTTIPRISRWETGGGLVATQWCYTARTPVRLWTAPHLPVAPSPYPIATSTQVEGDKIRSEHVYLDRQTVAEQLGLKAKWDLRLKAQVSPLRKANLYLTFGIL